MTSLFAEALLTPLMLCRDG